MKKNHSAKILIISGCLILQSYNDSVYATSTANESILKQTLEQVQISGTITDVSSSALIQGAKITLLNPDTRDLLDTDIYTNNMGIYDATIDLNFIDVAFESPQIPTAYWIGESHPNPFSPETNDHVTIQYVVSGNRPKTPMIEVYNILGRKVNLANQLSSGVYFYRLKFNDGYISNSKKIVLTSTGLVNFSLKQVFPNPDHQFGKNTTLGKTTTESMEVLFVIEKSGYAPMERTVEVEQGVNNVNNFAMVAVGNQSSATIDSTGGTITVVNSHGDTISLKIPHYAIWEPTTITLTTFDTPPENPIAQTIFPGVNLSPTGFKLHQAATLTIVFAAITPDTNMATLFFIQQSDFILALSNQQVAEHSIKGEIYHFSDLAVGEPSESEINGQADKATDYDLPSDPYNWEEIFDRIETILWWAEKMELLGDLDGANQKIQVATDIARQAANNFLTMPIPDDPCGDYLETLLKYTEMVNKLVGGDLDLQMGNRVNETINKCSLRGEIDCNHNLIYTGEGYQEIITANGSIPFSVDLQSPDTPITGAGSISGSGYGGGEGLTVIREGVITITIGGNLVGDPQSGIYRLNMSLTENWWNPGTTTLILADGTTTGPITPYQSTVQLNFNMTSGQQIQKPDPLGVGSGFRTYTLRIIHQP